MSLQSYLDMMDADAAAFRGDVMDDDKKARWDKFNRYCDDIAKMNSTAEHPLIPFSTNSRNAIAQVLFPEVNFIEDQRVIKRMAAMMTEADDLVLAVGEDGRIAVSFGIRDMWREFHYDYGPGRVTERYTNNPKK